VALAESLGSASSYLLIDGERQAVVGIEVNANHIKSVRTGTVKATGRLVHKGRATHVWDIRVTNEDSELVALCRITNMVIDRRT
jgi:1,4-dihydroxy-2-naphthoyl-CoA hydrolase